MPDIVSVFAKRWKLIVALTFTATVLAFVACLLTPKKYVGLVTALPANSMLGDKARIFNQNIEALYTALGTPDELDRVEGTAKLDTIFLALAKNHNLVSHYSIDAADTAALYRAANRLKKNTAINRTGYGELQIRVWDRNNQMAAALANAALQTLNSIHQQLLAENNRMILQQLKEEYAKEQQVHQGTINSRSLSGNRMDKQRSTGLANDSLRQASSHPGTPIANEAASINQLEQYARLINEYELALKTTPKILLAVENARPLPYADKPKTIQTVMLSFLAALLFSLLLALFAESRNQKA